MRFGHVHFPVTDLNRSVEFYRDRLALPLELHLERNMAAFGVGLVLDQAEGATSLRARGIPLGDPPQDQPWGVRNFYIRDPDGYAIEFTQPQKKD